jgi:hypothetical protein
MQFRELREPVPTTNDRTAFYNVTDVMQSMGLRDQKFDSIVLHCSNVGKFQKYAVFWSGENQQQQQQQQQRAVLIYYDTAQCNFWSDGMYHTYDFDASIVTSVVNAHIANEKFKFYILHK